MTLTEMIAYVRLQLSEERAAFYTDTNLTTYITNAMNRFALKTKALIHKDVIDVVEANMGEADTYGVTTVTCVADLTGSVNTINSLYFNLYDGNDLQYTVYFDTGTATVPTTGGTLVPVVIAVDDTADTIATLVQAQLDTLGVFTTTRVSNVLTITNVVAGHTSNTPANVNVSNGTDSLVVAYVNGVDEALSYTYKFLHERSIVYIPSNSSDSRVYLTRVAYEDWIMATATERSDNGLCWVDDINMRLYIPLLGDGKVYFQYHCLSSATHAATFINSFILPEEYHEAIANYAIHLAYGKDRENGLADKALQAYLDTETLARIEVEEKLVNPMRNDWNYNNTDPRGDETTMQSFRNIDA